MIINELINRQRQKKIDIIVKILSYYFICIGDFSELKIILNKSATRKIVIKFGIDPNVGKLHLGHAITLQRIKFLLRLLPNSELFFVVGTFTAKIGEQKHIGAEQHSLADHQINQNAFFIVSELHRIFSEETRMKKVRFFFNHKWLQNLNFDFFCKICRHLSSGLAAEKFRVKMNLASSFYPVLQSIDSLFLNSDIEVGGFDQLTNLLSARKIRSIVGLKKQFGILFPLVDFAGKKISKSKSETSFIHSQIALKTLKKKLRRMCRSDVLNLYELFYMFVDKEKKIQLFEKDRMIDHVAEKIFFDLFKRRKSQEDRFVFVFYSDKETLTINVTKILSLFFKISVLGAKRRIESRQVKINHKNLEKWFYTIRSEKIYVLSLLNRSIILFKK